MNYNLKKSLKQYGAIFEEAQSLIPATIGTDDEFGQVDVPGKESYVYVRIQSGEIAQAYNTKVVALAGLRVWCGYEKLRPGLLQVLDVRNVYGKEYQQKIPAHAKTHEYAGYDQVFIRGEQFIPKLVSKFSGMVVRVQAGAIYTDEFGWNWHNPQELNMSPYVPTTGAHWAMIEATSSGTLLVTVGATVQSKALLFATNLPSPHNSAQPLAAIALYSNQSGINVNKYGTSDIFDLRWHQSIKTGTAGGAGGIPEAPVDGNLYGRKNAGWTEVSGSAGMSEAPLDGLQYGRQSGSWTQVSGTGGGGLPDAPMDGLQYARQSGTWTYVTGSGATAYLQLTDVRITGTMTNGNTPVWIAASGAWYPMPIWEDSKDPTGFIDNDNIHMSYDVSTRKIYLSGTLSYYWHGIKRTLASGSNTWTSTPHDVADGLYYLYSSDGVNFAWSNSPWTFEMLQVAYAVKTTAPSPISFQFGARECHGLIQHQAHEVLHYTIGAYRESGGAPIVDSYQTNSANNAHTRPSFAAMDMHDEDVDTTVSGVTGTYTTLRITSGSTNLQAGEDYPFRATGSYILINNPTTGAETAAVGNRYLNVYQIAIPVTNDADSQKYRMVFLQPQVAYTSASLAQQEQLSSLNLGNFSSLFVETVFYTRITYSTSAANGNIGKVKIDSITYVTRVGAGVSASAGGAGVPATYVLSGTDYNMPASVGTALEYARADHLHGTPPSGTGGTGGLADAPLSGLLYGRLSGTWNQVSGTFFTDVVNVFSRQIIISGTVNENQLKIRGFTTQTQSLFSVEKADGDPIFRVENNGQVLITGSAIVLGGSTVNNVFSDIRINQTSGTSVYPNLKGNQNTSNLYYTVSDGMYTSGKLLVFLNGQALSQGKDWSEQHPASGTFFFISGSVIPTSTDIITAQYTISGTLAVADAPYSGLQYARQSGTWTQISAGFADAPTDGLPYIRQSGTWKSRYAVELESSPTTHGVTGTNATGSTYTSVACEFILGLPMLMSSIIWSNYRTGTYNINLYTAGAGKSLFSKFQYFSGTSDNLVALDKELLLLPGHYRIYVSGTAAINWYRWSAAAPVVEGIMYYSEGLFNNSVVSSYFPVAKIVGRIQTP